MRAIWNWLDFPGWWQGVSRPTDHKSIMGLTWLWVICGVLALAYIWATRQAPEPF
jgi:hypothetical protein